MEFDIAVSGNETADVYTLENRIAKAIAGVSGVLGCQLKRCPRIEKCKETKGTIELVAKAREVVK